MIIAHVFFSQFDGFAEQDFGFGQFALPLEHARQSGMSQGEAAFALHAPPHFEAFTQKLFRFVQLSLVREDFTQELQRAGQVGVVAGEHFIPQRQGLACHGFGFNRLVFVAQHGAQRIERLGDIRMFVAEQLSPGGQRLARHSLGLRQSGRRVRNPGAPLESQHRAQSVKRGGSFGGFPAPQLRLQREGLAGERLGFIQHAPVHQRIAHLAKRVGDGGAVLAKRGAGQPQIFAGHVLHVLVERQRVVNVRQRESQFDLHRRLVCEIPADPFGGLVENLAQHGAIPPQRRRRSDAIEHVLEKRGDLLAFGRLGDGPLLGGDGALAGALLVEKHPR